MAPYYIIKDNECSLQQLLGEKNSLLTQDIQTHDLLSYLSCLAKVLPSRISSSPTDHLPIIFCHLPLHNGKQRPLVAKKFIF